MPLLLEPKQRYAVVLESDKDKPKETRPVFWAYALSARESIAQQKSVEEITSDEQGLDFVKPLIVGWDNMLDADSNLIEYDVDRLGDIVTTSEVWELFRKINANNHVLEDDKKKYESQP